MKLPAVAIATALAAGIALGFWPVIANHAASPGFLRAAVLAAALLLAIATAIALRRLVGLASGLSLPAWFLLGISGAGIAQ